eukprot:CAMPEP_0176391078 /NCGR_PEP_ID=MMETSP0126-20121128/39721_1 /TAXON_ID=141414 ORGANISM="Strombidinopsis acuminatum, Strain SPMC142" /NCGR_SAMPLE_ID=MMETSP0126 /ASSEMBLY_ACC=CAM_ASM_000229 /LENGTH=65 /DNA_ID=CAMNT_0017760941 /DNA_START=133 /DNA_END=330 /DNA_ORIENTATION=+
MGPGTTLLGDILWDTTKVGGKRNLRVKIAMTLSVYEDLVSEDAAAKAALQEANQTGDDAKSNMHD